MSKAVLITRPDHDLITTYLLHWSEPVLQEANKKGIKVLDLRGKKANSKTFVSYITEHEPTLVFFNGHGSEDVITGYDNEVLVEANMLSTRATQSQKDAAPYLWFNRKHQVVLGDQEATM